MIGMDFVSFLILLVIALVVAIVLHYLLRYYAVSGLGSFFGKLVLAWIGGWLGSPVLGHWWEGVGYQNVYIVPAVLGSLALVVLVVDGTRSLRSEAAGTQAGESAPGADPGI